MERVKEHGKRCSILISSNCQAPCILLKCFCLFYLHCKHLFDFITGVVFFHFSQIRTTTGLGTRIIRFTRITLCMTEQKQCIYHTEERKREKDRPDLLFSRSCDFLAACVGFFSHHNAFSVTPFMVFSLLCIQYRDGEKNTLPLKDELRQTYHSIRLQNCYPKIHP